MICINMQKWEKMEKSLKIKQGQEPTFVVVSDEKKLF